MVSWKDWCWSWNSNTLTTSCEELTHWKRPWSWEGLWAGGEGDGRGWDGWMSSPTRWSELRELVMDREAWRAAIREVVKSWTRLSYWTQLNWAELGWKPEILPTRPPSAILPPGKNTFLTEVKVVNANTKFIRDISQQVVEHTEKSSV